VAPLVRLSNSHPSWPSNAADEASLDVSVSVFERLAVAGLSFAASGAGENDGVPSEPFEEGDAGFVDDDVQVRAGDPAGTFAGDTGTTATSS